MTKKTIQDASRQDSRRRFLQQAATISAAAVVPYHLTASRAAAATKNSRLQICADRSWRQWNANLPDGTAIR